MPIHKRPGALRITALTILLGTSAFLSKIARADSLTEAIARGRIRLEQFDGEARGQAERLSLMHQRDLLNALTNSERAAKILKLRLDADALVDGIVDSDLGKLQSQWEFTVFREVPETEAFLDFLRGASRSRASRVLREAVAAYGCAYCGLLGPELTNAQIREALRTSAELRGYLHELPGIYYAMLDLNARRISPRAFVRRVKANLFHNDGAGMDSTAGFFRARLEAVLVPKGLAKLPPDIAAKLFANTIFAGVKRDGVTYPTYGQPLSAETALHAILDRLSQGTRGGLRKILAEIGDAGLEQIKMLIGPHIESTIAQLQGLRAGLKTWSHIQPAARKFLDAEAADAIDRLRDGLKFYNLSVDVQEARARIEYIQPRREAIALHGAADTGSCAWFLSHVTRHEQELNGDPFDD